MELGGNYAGENKEDFYDYITKYKGNIFEFYALDTHTFNVEKKSDEETKIKYALNNSIIRIDGGKKC